MKQQIYDATARTLTIVEVDEPEIVPEPDPEPTPEELARASAVAKLKKLGLTEEEALALVGG